MKNEKYVIGVDGGGTKTVIALADLGGKVLKKAITGPSSPRNVGADETVENISKGIKRVMGKKNIVSVFAGLPAIEEEYKNKAKDIAEKCGPSMDGMQR